MNKLVISIVVGFVLIGGLLVLRATKESAAVILTPSDLIDKGSSVNISRIRVAGTVSTDPVEYTVQPEIKLKFSIKDPENPQLRLPVSYQGLKPDMFAPGRDVIIDGDFSNGTLKANKLLTQCPSKYEPPTPNHPAVQVDG